MSGNPTAREVIERSVLYGPYTTESRALAMAALAMLELADAIRATLVKP